MFDVDGTLTPSRGQMHESFSSWFQSFCKSHDVYLVTGSDKPKTLEQIGENVYNSCKRVYQCSGNDVWEKDINIRKNDWILPEDAHEWLSIKLTESDFPIRTGLHFEHRSGMVNFSIVGRNATQEEREKYVLFNRDVDERWKISSEFNSFFPDLQSTVGGDTGLDISLRGMSKKQVLTDFPKDAIINFYGDKMEPGGNDYEIAMRIRADGNTAVQVNDWRHTWKLLKEKCKQ